MGRLQGTSPPVRVKGRQVEGYLQVSRLNGQGRLSLLVLCKLLSQFFVVSPPQTPRTTLMTGSSISTATSPCTILTRSPQRSPPLDVNSTSSTSQRALRRLPPHLDQQQSPLAQVTTRWKSPRAAQSPLPRSCTPSLPSPMNPAMSAKQTTQLPQSTTSAARWKQLPCTNSAMSHHPRPPDPLSRRVLLVARAQARSQACPIHLPGLAAADAINSVSLGRAIVSSSTVGAASVDTPMTASRVPASSLNPRARKSKLPRRGAKHATLRLSLDTSSHQAHDAALLPAAGGDTSTIYHDFSSNLGGKCEVFTTFIMIF